jgi:GT2 family glycosyltransferase
MIHIVLPVHDRVAVTAEFIAALQRQTFTDFRLLLVDDGCRDSTVAHVRQALPPARLRVLSGDGNLWWGGALHRAWEALRDEAPPAGDAVLICNDDVTFGPDFLAQGLAALAEQAGSAVQATGVDRDTGTVDRGAVVNLLTLRFRGAAAGEAPNCLSTRCLLMPARMFVDSGGFRPAQLPHYLSDYEFTLRLRRQGVALRCASRFAAMVRLDLTGPDRADARAGLRRFLSESFSNRAKHNPVRYSAFVRLACPPWVVPLHLARIWLRFGLRLSRAALNSALCRSGPTPQRTMPAPAAPAQPAERAKSAARAHRTPHA